MSMKDISMGEEQLDDLCWQIMGWINRFHPPKETAEECVEVLDNEEGVKDREFIMEHEIGYHTGCVVVADDIAETLLYNGVDVVGRAKRVERSMEAHSDTYESDVDYPDLVTYLGGHRESALDEVEMEDLDPNPPYASE